MASTAPSPEQPIGQRELVVLIALLMSLNALAIDGMLPALDEIAREFGVAAGNQRQLIVSVYLLATGIGCLVPGAFADRYGRRPMMLFALAAYVAVLADRRASANFDRCCWSRAGLQGLLAAGLMVAPVAIDPRPL